LWGWDFGHKEFQVLDQSRSVMPLVPTAQWVFFFFHFGYRTFQYFKNISKLFEFTLEKPATTDHPKNPNFFSEKERISFFFFKEEKHH